MKKYYAILLLLLLGIIGYWYYAPTMTLQKIEEGITKKDRYLLQEAIDFEKLRSNLKSQLKSKLSDEKLTTNNPLGTIAVAFATKVIDGMVDTMVTPDALITKDEKKLQKAKEVLQSAQIVDRSLDRVTVRVIDRDGSEYYGILQRYGMQYRLTDIRIPESKTKDIFEKK